MTNIWQIVWQILGNLKPFHFRAKKFRAYPFPFDTCFKSLKMKKG